jgi:hypothetical protein
LGNFAAFKPIDSNCQIQPVAFLQQAKNNKTIFHFLDLGQVFTLKAELNYF